METENTRPEATESLVIRPATREDAEAVAAILTEAFSPLYQATFGRLSGREIASLLAKLYRVGTLSLETTRLCEREGRVVGVAILHIGKSIGRGGVLQYGSALYRQLGGWRALRAFFGGLSTNAFLNRRIPRAPDLVYIEALAVTEPERSRGVGTRLLADADAWAQAQGRHRLALHVLYNNTGARRLYERLGFRPGLRDLSENNSSRRRPRWASLLLERALVELPK